MKSYYFIVLTIATAILILPACSQNQSGTEKVIDNIGDALDKRPGERAHDAAEERDEVNTKIN